jgi:hypothetical protein
MMLIGDTPRRARFHPLPADTKPVLVDWQRFDSLRGARAAFWSTSCLYVFTNLEHIAQYVGKASTGLGPRYSSAPEKSRGALVFVARIEQPFLEFVEHMTIFYGCPWYNRNGRSTLPLPHVPILHRFDGVESWWGASTLSNCLRRRYDGPLFQRPGITREAGTGRLLA